MTKNGVLFGELNFENHTNGDHIHAHFVTNYVHPTTGPLSSYPDSRMIEGMGTINGSGSFPVEFRIVDLGEPGVNDRVYLKVNGVVLIPEMQRDGGNVQLHKVCRNGPLK